MTNSLFKLHRLTAGLVFLTGAVLHTTVLIIGKEKFIANVLTPLSDSIFGIVMAFAGISGIILRKSIQFNKSWKKVVHRIAVAYLTVSIPLHIQVIVTQDTSYVTAFPETYSYFIIPVLLFFAVFFFTQVKSKSN